MVTFLTFFLGLTIGVQDVHLAVGEEVAFVELRLDGEVVDVRHALPWLLKCDFGLELQPHHLEAVAYDHAGRELGRTEQVINLSRPFAEASLALGDYRGGRYREITLAWKAADESDPIEVSIEFDGQSLEVIEKRVAALPPHDPERIHILTAELVFPMENRAHVELAFGGQYGESVSTELTAIDVTRLAAKPPSLDSLQGSFLVAGKPVPVVAVEQSRAQVFVVRDRNAIAALQALDFGARGRRRSISPFYGGLARRDVLRFVQTWPHRVAASGRALVHLYPITENFNRQPWRGIAQALTQMRLESDASGAAQRLADAVAIAGREAAASNQTRAVVLVVADASSDHSGFELVNVQRFLRHLQVPLLIWRIDETENVATSWGEGTSIASVRDLNRAVRSLRRQLDRQLIVWLDGRHLPNHVTLAPAAQERLRLSGSQL